jgi:SAM-dependent methyltransferase
MLERDSRLGMRVRKVQRRCLRLVGGRSERDLEYEFVLRHVGGHNLQVLDVGGTGSLFPLDLAREGHMVTLCDVRPYPERHPNLTVVEGDFLATRFPCARFDVVIMVSTLEHIGFGHYGDPFIEDGDRLAIDHVWRVLKEHGRVILTTPFTDKERIINGFERWYDMDRLTQLLEDFRIRVSEFWVPTLWLCGRCLRWTQATLEQAKRAESVCGYHSTACLVAEKGPQDGTPHP